MLFELYTRCHDEMPVFGATWWLLGMALIPSVYLIYQTGKSTCA